MGYDLYITRAESWTRSQSRPITPDEWLGIVDGDPGLDIDRGHGPLFAVFADDTDFRWLDWRDGNIYSKWPDRVTLAKMLDIAEALGGTVQGEEGERYTSVEQIPEVRTMAEAPTGWWRSKLLYERREIVREILAIATIVSAIAAINYFDLI